MEEIQMNQYEQKNTNLSISPTDLKNLAGWAKFVAIMQIIFGALSCLAFIYIIPIALGIFQIIMAVKLLNASKSITDFVNTGNNYSLSDSLQNFRSYFKINGIMLIISMACAIVLIILAILAIGMFGSVLSKYKMGY